MLLFEISILSHGVRKLRHVLREAKRVHQTAVCEVSLVWDHHSIIGDMLVGCEVVRGGHKGFRRPCAPTFARVVNARPSVGL
jgi:hypothetical protein